MLLRRKVVLASACIMAPYIAYVIYLVASGPGRVQELPKWVLATALCYLIGSLVAIWVIARFLSKKEGSGRNENVMPRLSSSARGLKRGLIVWTAILVFAIVLLLLRIVPLEYAIPGLAVDIFMILFYGRSLMRLKTGDRKL